MVKGEEPTPSQAELLKIDEKLPLLLLIGADWVVPASVIETLPVGAVEPAEDGAGERHCCRMAVDYSRAGQAGGTRWQLPVGQAKSAAFGPRLGR